MLVLQFKYGTNTAVVAQLKTGWCNLLEPLPYIANHIQSCTLPPLVLQNSIMKTIVFFLSAVAMSEAFVQQMAGTVTTTKPSLSPLLAKKVSDEIPTDEVDVIVIGSGLAGLSCAALLSHCDKETVVFEAHDTPGGAVS